MIMADLERANEVSFKKDRKQNMLQVVSKIKEVVKNLEMHMACMSGSNTRISC